MSVQTSLDMSGLDAFIACKPRVAEARDEVAKLIAFDWAQNVEDAETGEDAPDQRDYDENITVDEEGPNSTVVETDIEWAVDNEYGLHLKPGTGAARQAAEAHREDFTNAVAAALVG